MKIITTKKRSTEQLTLQQGFTLLEVLMVITIVSIMVSVTVLSFGALDQRRLNSEVSKLQLALNQASDAALMKQINLGWFFQEEDNTYYFLQLSDKGTWIEPESSQIQKNIFRSHTLNSAIHLSIEVPPKPFELSSFEHSPFKHDRNDNEQEINFGLGDNSDTKFSPPKESPYLLFLSSGEYTPFDIRITDDVRNPIQLQGNGFGNIISSLVKS